MFISKILKMKVTKKAYCTVHDFKSGSEGWGFREFIKIDDLLNKKLELLPNNKLTLCLEIEVINEINPKNYKKF